MGNPVARAFAITGDAWTQLILREAFYGVRRFGVWRERLGTPRSVLTDRLQKLVAAGLLSQEQVATGTRTEYRLTEMGLDMFGVAVVQGQWEKVWAQSPLQERYAIAFFDRETGRRLKPAVLTRARRRGETRQGRLEAWPGPHHHPAPDLAPTTLGADRDGSSDHRPLDRDHGRLLELGGAVGGLFPSAPL